MMIGASRSELVNRVLSQVSTYSLDKPMKDVVTQLAYGVARAIETNNEEVERALRRLNS